jgi:hypothetical protein
MPVAQRHDTQGSYYQWGNHGHKYYFNPNSDQSRSTAKTHATKQGMAAHANGWHGD